MHFDGVAPFAGRSEATCPFCHPNSLGIILTTTENFYILVDHAPLIEGHLLIVPKVHYACYGAVPETLDGELLALKSRVADFLTAEYRPPVFFEHGVYRQTVYHAHLHAFPFGPVHLDLAALARPEGEPVTSQADVRKWYAERGPYFYLEEASIGGDNGEAAIFPPDDTYYIRALGSLRAASRATATWQPPALRRQFSQGKVRAVAQAWERFAGVAPVQMRVE